MYRRRSPIINCYLYNNFILTESGSVVLSTITEYLLVLLRGSRGPSTVTFIHLAYTATCGGLVLMEMVKLKLLPEMKSKQMLIQEMPLSL